MTIKKEIVARSEYQFRLIAGIRIRKNIRMILESEHFGGRNIRWMEYKGLISSTFYVRGESSDTKAVESRLITYMQLCSIW